MFPSPKIQMALTFPSLSLTGVFNLLCRLQNTECRCIGFLAEGWVVTASDKLEMTPNWPSVIHTPQKFSDKPSKTHPNIKLLLYTKYTEIEKVYSNQNTVVSDERGLLLQYRRTFMHFCSKPTEKRFTVVSKTS